MTPHRALSGTRGFTLVELMVVLAIAATLLSITVVSISSVQSRTAARSAAQHFSRDLAQARTWALRSHESVTVTFDESADSLLYRLVSESGDTIVRRTFGAGAEVRLTSLDLLMNGDSLRFEADGVASLAEANPAGTTATAAFVAGPRRFVVRFNARGNGEVEPG